ncbi:DUF397 domain-containing protein [Allostreptomyces psammosilenae]|uniref:DUF397 domain-containing protein n=1 Tax=Allostreptomyces psammosilenae TaxID=1892865 RepID=A0A853A5Q8_9ACTN|nr:DUF397 domain-containing protein [Allostreptomyces psammosilenae]NYI06021.1 hypothetical protein [Allostreptomyces psammosilenae]
MCDLSTKVWRKSSYSTAGGDCVEVNADVDGRVGVRDSKDPAGGALLFERSEIAAWLASIKAGRFTP